MSLLKEVKLSAVLREHNGFFYLPVPNEIIDGFIKMIPNRYGKVVRPAKAIEKDEDVGAHISVLHLDEMKKKRSVKEVGEEFDYTIEKLYSTKPSNWENVEEVYFISVKSLQLEALRKKYGLKQKHNGHDFHITVAIEKV